MLFNILRQCSPEDLKGMDDTEVPEELKALLKKPEEELAVDQKKRVRKLTLRNKINSVGRMNLMLSNMRKNQE